VISNTVVAVLEALGYRAKSHHDAHYDCILPPLAVEAGLGEVGRHNILITDRYGTRVRIGAVTTDFPISHNRPINLGVEHFCMHCRKCAVNCPSRSLESGERQDIRGVLKWPTEADRCYAYWRQMSSDCGICMSVCPFSHRSDFESAMNGFSNLTDATLLGVQPDRIRIVRGEREETLRTFLLSRGVPQERLEEHSLLNGRRLEDMVVEGEPVKIVEPGRD
ncbi:4Fe-4S dicluster domain-containing protein, partial [Gemmatimonadota bacterium]